ncbi:hypothetical protein LJR030_002946 [Rhizobium sp. LjRoot30]|uniref:hypothetical protein n=1 Tax=Rhizobium sp. LjRoot30 TaxID=3342320 RepID=UPI003ECC3565
MIGSPSLQVHFAGSASVESWAKQFDLTAPDERALIDRVRAWVTEHFDPCIALTESAFFHLLNDVYASGSDIKGGHDGSVRSEVE